MNGQLPDIDEGILISNVIIQGKDFHIGALHEVDQGQGVGRRKLAIPHINHVQLLEQKQGKNRNMYNEVEKHTKN